MGRTQPSLTRAIEEEIEKLERVSKKLRNVEMSKKLINVRKNVRIVEEALQDELTDPLEVIMIAILVSE
ncbi:hypothetical protein [Sulfuracidifex metallicus]|jgi:hypothetical protein|uniref:DNA polymerase II n=1 Tax=Sulfuracidifex metallicus DSM 6482 = JCM 9184 TaxID=523847 RepID=A0A6A9QGQ3_SULME|nr:hypothetical protein [Sulfuracidifex metallicus]MCY0850632.1 DNA polymerase II [Sulfuracidifex metallicus]MUN28387.1 DNA polymerase II [Sulfuracidifex metallicus DSM 6482 = JCM 9184]WOE51094.1 DNA polymerase II [Sulfuracidifex metallicus DSM 6482 = JCM 9184]